MSLVPMVFVPLNIMCSKKWLRPVMPGRSFTEPTRATQPAATVGDSWRSKSSHFMPLPRTTSVDVDLGLLGRPAWGSGRQGKGEAERAGARFDCGRFWPLDWEASGEAGAYQRAHRAGKFRFEADAALCPASLDPRAERTRT